jgi:hypothetical protein
MMRHAASLALGLALAASVAGCAGGDTSLYIRNDSQESWYLSVERVPGDLGSLWVVKVAPGADTFALSWNGGDEVPVAVLRPDCTPVGNLQLSTDGTWATNVAPGLTGRIENSGGPFGSRSTTPGVEDTEDCGGFLYR